MQHKFTKSLLATAILFGLTACGSSGGGGSSEPTTKVNTAVETIKPSTTKPSGTSTNTTKPNNTGEATSTTSGNEVKPNNTGTTTSTTAANTDKQETITVPTVGNDSKNTTANLTNANDIQNEIKKSTFKLDNLGNPTGNAIYTSVDGTIVLKANFDDRLISGNMNAFFVEYEFESGNYYNRGSEITNNQYVKFLNMNPDYKNVKSFDISVDLQETSLYRDGQGYTFSGNATGKSNDPEYSQLEGIYDGGISNEGYSRGSVTINLSDKIRTYKHIYRQ